MSAMIPIMVIIDMQLGYWAKKATSDDVIAKEEHNAMKHFYK